MPSTPTDWSSTSTATPPPSTSLEAAPPPWLAAMLSVPQQQNQQMVSMMEKLLENKAAPTTLPAIPFPAPGDLVRDLPTFCYDNDDDITFKDSSPPSMIELDRHAYKTYTDYVLPQEPRHINLAATVDKLTKLFGPKQTLIRRRFEFLQSTCEPLSTSHVPYRDFSNKIKKKFEDASMKDVDGDSLKCLVFLSGLPL
ncbi:unnamed protein product [Heligmosomoides polygyrus]|uniref:SAP30_Sin3_bdg domain-containing protein n=1 Tax=Heligmosomoides polygyrus TaxID=6339 RepID=A0A183GVB6_HELPZ|nr:unnamed protein product [Heligmosomoides polygyrus]